MKPYDVLNESIKFATKQLNNFKANNDLSDISIMVTTALYRKVIELSEGVRVSGANGLAGPAELNYRGLIEAYLALKYILQDEELLIKRASAYKIGYPNFKLKHLNMLKILILIKKHFMIMPLNIIKSKLESMS